MLGGAVAAGNRDLLGQAEHGPQVAYPRAGGDDELIAADLAPVGRHPGDRAAAGAHTGDMDAWHDPHALRLRLRRQALQRANVVGVAALLLVQNHCGAGRLPVVKHVQHVGAAIALALDERGRVTDRLLLGEDLRDVLVHLLRRDLQVTDGVIGERRRV
jgi:hypothetical protein